jgi:hypothetical protein
MQTAAVDAFSCLSVFLSFLAFAFSTAPESCIAISKCFNVNFLYNFKLLCLRRIQFKALETMFSYEFGYINASVILLTFFLLYSLKIDEDPPGFIPQLILKDSILYRHFTEGCKYHSKFKTQKSSKIPEIWPVKFVKSHQNSEIMKINSHKISEKISVKSLFDNRFRISKESPRNRKNRSTGRFAKKSRSVPIQKNPRTLFIAIFSSAS